MDDYWKTHAQISCDSTGNKSTVTKRVEVLLQKKLPIVRHNSLVRRMRQVDEKLEINLSCTVVPGLWVPQQDHISREGGGMGWKASGNQEL